jgi:hypothetical protein
MLAGKDWKDFQSCLNNKKENYVAQLFSWVQTFTPLKFVFFCNIQKIKWVAQFVEIVRTRADHPPCQPTISDQLLLDGGKIEPFTIIIMAKTLVAANVFTKTINTRLPVSNPIMWQFEFLQNFFPDTILGNSTLGGGQIH